MLRDWRTAPVDDRMRAALAFLEKLTLMPTDLAPADAEAARAAGLSDLALNELVHVSFAFEVADRLADALDWEIPNERSLRWVQRILLNLGYSGASIAG